MFLHMNIRTFVTILSRKAQCNFPKMRGGVKGRFELFRKFIRFGNVRRPEVKHVTDRVRGGAYQWWRLWRLIQLSRYGSPGGHWCQNAGDLPQELQRNVTHVVCIILRSKQEELLAEWVCCDISISGVNKNLQIFIFEYWVFSQKSYLNMWCLEKIHICIPKIQYLYSIP